MVDKPPMTPGEALYLIEAARNGNRKPLAYSRSQQWWRDECERRAKRTLDDALAISQRMAERAMESR
jgi:hypothetical protein